MAKNHPFDLTVNDLFRKLEEALKQRQEAEIQITTSTAAIRALANTCEDEDVKATYLLKLEELSGKSGFMDAVRSVLRGHGQKNPLTPTEVRTWIILGKRMDLSGYSNAMASIHTTLRRMKVKGEIEEVQKDGEKAYRLVVKAPVPPRRRPGRFDLLG